MRNIVVVDGLTKKYKVAKRDKNLFKYIFFRKYVEVDALNRINFSIKEGELVGFIGPNGAGKSTAIKIMTGILTPTEGTVKVFDKDPYKNRKINMFDIGVVFGQRTQLWWDLPLVDTFILLKKIYHISNKEYMERMELFKTYLNMDHYLTKPVRQLSLGERMKAEIATAFLHNPKMLFLDEPTIGLDVSVKHQVRTFIKYLNKKYNTTVILTTHDMKDIEEICNRVILINKGEIMLDCHMGELKKRFGSEMVLSFEFSSKVDRLTHLAGITDMKKENDGFRWLVKIDKRIIPPGDIIFELSKEFSVKNVEFQERSIDDIVRDLYELSSPVS